MPVPSSAEPPPPFTLRQARENARFLEILGQTGNARLAAREVRRAHSTMFERRVKNAGFAQRWEAAVAAAHARFHLAGGKRGPDGEAAPTKRNRKVDPGLRRDDRIAAPGDGERPLRTEGGEPVVVRTRTGRLQLRPAHPGKLTKACEQAFLLALSATANVRLSAAAAGASARAFYRRRERDPAFAREMRLALDRGYERLDLAVTTAGLACSHEDDEWRNCEPRPIPPMSVGQALQLLYLHEKSVRQRWEQPHRRRRRGESDETHFARLDAMWRAEQARLAEEAALRRAARYEESGDWRFADEQPGPPLPPLELVTGWSKADPKARPHNPERALFGGWRLQEMERKLGRKG